MAELARRPGSPGSARSASAARTSTSSSKRRRRRPTRPAEVRLRAAAAPVTLSATTPEALAEMARLYADAMAVARCRRWPIWRTSPMPAEATSPTARRSLRATAAEAAAMLRIVATSGTDAQPLRGKAESGRRPGRRVPVHRPGITVRRHGAAALPDPADVSARPRPVCCDPCR